METATGERRGMPCGQGRKRRTVVSKACGFPCAVCFEESPHAILGYFSLRHGLPLHSPHHHIAPPTEICISRTTRKGTQCILFRRLFIMLENTKKILPHPRLPEPSLASLWSPTQLSPFLGGVNLGTPPQQASWTWTLRTHTETDACMSHNPIGRKKTDRQKIFLTQPHTTR